MRVQRVATQGKAIPQSLPDSVLTCANPGCNAAFTPVRKWQKYHNSACRFRAWNRLRVLREPAGQPAEAAAQAGASAKAGRHWSRRNKPASPESKPRNFGPQEPADSSAEASAKAEVRRTKARLTIHCVMELS